MEEYDLLIIGAGPAGLTAGIYGARSGLKTKILEAMMVGGQTALSPMIENYPGFPEIDGQGLMKAFRDHAERYVEIEEGFEVEEIRPTEGGFIVKSDDEELRSSAVILATGAEHRKLGVPGEEELSGKGVSYCATCDGFFFKGKRVVVVGGGNTAVTEAIYLLDIGVDVTLVHRRDQLRADKALGDRYLSKGGSIEWNTVVSRIEGEGKVERVVLKDTVTGEEREMAVDGVFISVGIVPKTELARRLGVETDETGYVIVDKKQATNVQGVYAAGDITGGVRQIVTGCGQGAIAALSAYEYITHEKWSQ
ncbi:MAG: thioredoxin-disulfide reductase [Thermoplasmata archaeon]|nr:thioredoxin-disulfide reductase [Thermoplasmata archaeon]